MNLNLMLFIQKMDLLQIKDGEFVKYFDEPKSIGTRWAIVCVKIDVATYFGSFGIEHNPKRIFR